VPTGVKRIEAVTPDGVGNTEGIPAEQQVVVGVVDSGIDATHPDINYAGGQSWAANDANADRDGYGEGFRLLCVLLALCDSLH
jgi:subtilisin family serine protease